MDHPGELVHGNDRVRPHEAVEGVRRLAGLDDHRRFIDKADSASRQDW